MTQRSGCCQTRHLTIFSTNSNLATRMSHRRHHDNYTIVRVPKQRWARQKVEQLLKPGCYKNNRSATSTHDNHYRKMIVGKTSSIIFHPRAVSKPISIILFNVWVKVDHHFKPSRDKNKKQAVSRINSSTLAMLLPLSSLGKALSFLCSLLLPFPGVCRLEMSPVVQDIYWAVHLFVFFASFIVNFKYIKSYLY